MNGRLVCIILSTFSLNLFAGTVGLCMYFIQEGIVDVLNDQSEVVTSLSDGSYFGEIAPLCNTRRTASVRADTYCNLYSFSREDMLQILSEYPLMRRTIETIAAERLEHLGKDPKIITQRADLEDDLSAVKQLVQSLVAHSRNNVRKKRATGEKRGSRAHDESDRDIEARDDEEGVASGREGKRRSLKKSGRKMRLSVDRARSECDSDAEADDSLLRKARSRGVRRSIAEKLHEVTKRINKPMFLQVSGSATPRPDKDLKRTSSTPGDARDVKHSVLTFGMESTGSGAPEVSIQDLDGSQNSGATSCEPITSDGNRYLSARRKSGTPESSTSNEAEIRDEAEEDASDADDRSRRRHAADSSRGKSFSFLPKNSTIGKKMLEVLAPLKKLSTSHQGASAVESSCTDDSVAPAHQKNVSSHSASAHPKLHGVPAMLVGIGLQLGESIFNEVNRPPMPKSTTTTTTSALCSAPPPEDPISLTISAADPVPFPNTCVTIGGGIDHSKNGEEDPADFPAMDEAPAVIHLPI